MSKKIMSTQQDSDDPNRSTLKTYGKYFREYILNTPSTYTSIHKPLQKWLDESLSFVRPSGKVLEIGSATPRDASYVQGKGMVVTCSDATPAFVKYISEHGMNAILLNVLKDPIPEQYDMIFANAVVPHFTRKQFENVLKKVYDALPVGGVFAFSAKQGSGEEWVHEKISGARFVHFWQPAELKEVVQDAGFTIVYLNTDIPGDLSTHRLIHLTAQKKS